MNVPSSPNSWSRERALFHFRRLSVNAVLQISSQLLPLLAGAAALPLIYKRIHGADFGVFTIGLSALGLFSLLDLGLGRAAVHFMARAFADRNTTRAASVAVHSGLLLGAFSLGLSILFLASVPVIATHWFQYAGQAQQVLRQCLYILAAALPFAGPMSAFRSVLEARENFLVIGIIQAVLGTLTYCVPLLLSFSTSDVRIILAGAVICRGFAFLAFMIAALVIWPGPFPWRAVDIRSQHEFRSFSAWMVISNVVGSCIVYGDRALLIRLFGLAQIPFYNVPLELLGRLMIIMNSAATVVFPAWSRIAGKKELFDGVFVGMTTLLSAVIGLALVGLSLFTPFGLHLWLGDEFRDHSTTIVRILLIGLLFQCLNVLAMTSLNARGFARPITLMHLVETPVYFLSLYLCGLRFGLNGVALVWSGRLVVEYVCFVGFQGSIASKEGAGERSAGAVLAACNAIPLAMLVFTDNRFAVTAVGALVALCSGAWAVSLLRKEYLDAFR